MQEDRWGYLDKLKEVDSEGIKHVTEELQDSKSVVMAGKGRSGWVARICARYLNDVGKPTFFYEDPGSPRIEDCEDGEIALIAVSGSGETGEVVNAAEAYKRAGSNVIAMTANPNSSLAEIVNEVIEVKKGKNGGGESYYMTRQAVRPDRPTMGDLSEEMSGLSGFLSAMKLYDNALDVKRRAKEEVNDLKDVLDEKERAYNRVENSLEEFWDQEIIFSGMGKSKDVINMVANRANHYGAEVSTIGEPTAPPVRPSDLVVIVSGSGSAGGLYKDMVSEIKENQVSEVGDNLQRPSILSIMGRGDGIERESDLSLNLEGARPYVGTAIDTRGEPEIFYWRAAVVFNMMLREIAGEKGITPKQARERHINI